MNLPPGLQRQGTPSSPRGRFLCAARSFKPGELIAHFTTPSLVLPDSPSLHVTCSYCLRTDLDVRACTGCLCTYYCSAPCQKSDWSLVHKAECKVFKRVQAEGHGVLPTPVRALVQMLLRADLRAAAAEMESHVEVYRNNNVEWKDMELQALASLHYLDQDATPKRLSEALELLCKLQVNSFSRTDEDIGQTGIFANPALAMANHSCIPNAIVQFIGRKAFLRANVTIKEGEAIEISYIDCNLHRSQRQKQLRERWHFDCICPRCKDNLDVYQVARGYSQIKLNAVSLNLDLTVSPEPASTSRNQALQTGIEEIYNACSRDPSNPNSSSDAGQSLRRRWKRCEPLRKVNLFAIEPLARVLGDATLYFGEREDFVFGAVVTCFLALNTDPIKTPMPFGPSRLKGLLVLANILSHTGPISGSNVSSSDKSLRGRVAQALSKMDQATIAQAILGIVVYWSRVAHAEGWHVYQEASAQLKDLESLPGRKKERELVQIWLKDQDDVEAAMFFDYAVMRPLRDLAGFTLDVMDSAFGTE